jgi:hypothetical protein
MSTLCLHGARPDEDCRLCWLDRIDSTRPTPGEFVEKEFLGWPYAEWELLKARWEVHYPGLRPSQVRLKTEEHFERSVNRNRELLERLADEEGLNPPMPRFF